MSDKIADVNLLSVIKGDIVYPHPEGGWPEFEVTLRFYVTCDDRAAVEAAREQFFEGIEPGDLNFELALGRVKAHIAGLTGGAGQVVND